ncbi:MAG: hypothetical protein J6X55_00955, partial [Victivallales bacterium]|nr:hypothetical protein [Victivallales bacterium]
MNILDNLIEKNYATDNLACFIEREEILRAHADETAALPTSERYLHEATLLFEKLSTPIESEDVFAGRMLEGRWPHSEPFTRIPGGIVSSGHITLAMPKILTIGFDGILAEVAANAQRIGTDEAHYFERQAKGCIMGIRNYCNRYADAAEAMGKHEMARALRIVPCKPAYDMYSALQSIWMVQFIFSTIFGSRDFAPGRIDQYLLPFYRRNPSPDETRSLLAHFLLKFNEITGTATDNYARKPTPCQASKQYLTLGGSDLDGHCQFNELSRLFIEAAQIIHLPQPTFNFRIGTDMTDDAWKLTGEAASTLDAQCNFFNENIIHNRLLNAGIRPEDACNYDFTACNRVDLPGKLHNIMPRIDRFDNSFVWFREALFSASSEGNAVEAILAELMKIAEAFIENDLSTNLSCVFEVDDYRFTCESLFLDSCVQTCTDLRRKGCDIYRWNHRMFSGIANMADSLVAVKRLIDEQKRFSLPELRQILNDNFQGHEELLDELRFRMPKYGNGIPEVDDLAARAANVLIDAAEKAARKTGFIMMTSLYSLTHHAQFGSTIGATPDGRLAGDTISENQSPVHGMDVNGPTELLKSVAKLPHHRCICGGLNMKFSSRLPADTLESLIRSYFAMGGLHVGFTMVNRETLEDARLHPEKHRSLLIRKTGFSEFYISLSP